MRSPRILSHLAEVGDSDSVLAQAMFEKRGDGTLAPGKTNQALRAIFNAVAEDLLRKTAQAAVSHAKQMLILAPSTNAL